MLSDEVRRVYTARGQEAISPWNDSRNTYSVLMINLGNNFISKLEIVSALNSFNIGRWEYYYADSNCPQKYNPKVYFGTIQTLGNSWNSDSDSARKGPLQGGEKSGSWPQKIYLIYSYIKYTVL